MEVLFKRIDELFDEKLDEMKKIIAGLVPVKKQVEDLEEQVEEIKIEEETEDKIEVSDLDQVFQKFNREFEEWKASRFAKEQSRGTHDISLASRSPRIV